MQKDLQDPLAEKILLGEILDGSTVKVTAGSDRLNFRSKPTVVATEAAARFWAEAIENRAHRIRPMRRALAFAQARVAKPVLISDERGGRGG